jgi:YD repeat-containing protein
VHPWVADQACLPIPQALPRPDRSLLSSSPASKRDTAYTGDKLTAIEDPESESIAYTYSGDMLATLTNKVGNTTEFAYGDHGRVDTITRPDDVDVYLQAFQVQGLAGTGTGTQMNPATAVLAAGGPRHRIRDRLQSPILN